LRSKANEFRGSAQTIAASGRRTLRFRFHAKPKQPVKPGKSRKRAGDEDRSVMKQYIIERHSSELRDQLPRKIILGKTTSRVDSGVKAA
jgi:hypothetical protein